jgi:hypothetical protein
VADAGTYKPQPKPVVTGQEQSPPGGEPPKP